MIDIILYMCDIYIYYTQGDDDELEQLELNIDEEEKEKGLVEASPRKRKLEAQFSNASNVSVDSCGCPQSLLMDVEAEASQKKRTLEAKFFNNSNVSVELSECYKYLLMDVDADEFLRLMLLEYTQAQLKQVGIAFISCTFA